MAPSGSELRVDTADAVEVVDVTGAVTDAVPAGLAAGLCHVFVPHTTAGVIVNEHESRLVADLERRLERLVPRDDDYAHDDVDDNAAAHLRSTLLGEGVTLPVRGGELALGRWQSVLLVEGDGPRSRRLTVTCLAGGATG